MLTLFQDNNLKSIDYDFPSKFYCSFTTDDSTFIPVQLQRNRLTVAKFRMKETFCLYFNCTEMFDCWDADNHAGFCHDILFDCEFATRRN